MDRRKISNKLLVL